MALDIYDNEYFCSKQTSIINKINLSSHLIYTRSIVTLHRSQFSSEQKLLFRRLLALFLLCDFFTGLPLFRVFLCFILRRFYLVLFLGFFLLVHLIIFTTFFIILSTAIVPIIIIVNTMRSNQCNRTLTSSNLYSSSIRKKNVNILL